MTVVEQQLHGYRHGHELLSASMRLPPQDQDLVDRLSDVAGPLGPGERFAPYLTCYPLPSGSHYVLARTWQDLTAPRAGCVRTRSFLISMGDWVTNAGPAALAEATAEYGPTRAAERTSISDFESKQLPPVEGVATELLEALFLERRMPVAVFGADKPEIIGLRLLTAIWPSYRRRFTLSTFCNSPRFIVKRSFDLVFAPVEAGSRFSDWKGRRIDGQRLAVPRHRWSTLIIDQVFRAPQPSLRGLDKLGEMAGDAHGSEDALRVSLLWDELQRKVASEPHAALGLLDIANTRALRSTDLVRDLGPALANAAALAIATMPAQEAWRFLRILIAKIGRTRPKLSVVKSITASARSLAKQRPRDAIEALRTQPREDRTKLLLGAVGDGLARSSSDDVGKLFADLSPDELLTLLSVSPALAEKLLNTDSGMDALLAAGLKEVKGQIGMRVRNRLLRHITSQRHVDAFRVLVAGMTGTELIQQVFRLHLANGLRSPGLNGAIIEEAKHVGAIPLLRDALASLGRSPAIDNMLSALVRPRLADLRWILDQRALDNDLRRSLLVRVLEAASLAQLARMFSTSEIISKAIAVLGPVDCAVAASLRKIAENVPMDPEEFLALVAHVLPYAEGQSAADLARRGFEAGLIRDFGPSRDASMGTLIARAGSGLRGETAIRTGLSAAVPVDLANRNLELFDGAAPPARAQFLRHPEALADALIGRGGVDLSYEAAQAAGRLLWDADAVDHSRFTRASAKLLPFLLEERSSSASPLIAAAFPPVYRALRQERLPDFMALAFLFLDWDRCKHARWRLAEGFLRSEWRPADIALAAARAEDPERILRHIARDEHGLDVLTEIGRDLGKIAPPWQQAVREALISLKEENAR